MSDYGDDEAEIAKGDEGEEGEAAVRESPCLVDVVRLVLETSCWSMVVPKMWC